MAGRGPTLRLYVFACDDRAARKEADLCGVPLTGAVGILIKAVREGVADLRNANRILGRMVRGGFYAPVTQITRDMVEGSP